MRRSLPAAPSPMRPWRSIRPGPVTTTRWRSFTWATVLGVVRASPRRSPRARIPQRRPRSGQGHVLLVDQPLVVLAERQLARFTRVLRGSSPRGHAACRDFPARLRRRPPPRRPSAGRVVPSTRAHAIAGRHGTSGASRRRARRWSTLGSLREARARLEQPLVLAAIEAVEARGAVADS